MNELLNKLARPPVGDYSISHIYFSRPTTANRSRRNRRIRGSRPSTKHRSSPSTEPFRKSRFARWAPRDYFPRLRVLPASETIRRDGFLDDVFRSEGQ